MGSTQNSWKPSPVDSSAPTMQMRHAAQRIRARLRELVVTAAPTLLCAAEVDRALAAALGVRPRS